MLRIYNNTSKETQFIILETQKDSLKPKLKYQLTNVSHARRRALNGYGCEHLVI